MTPRSHPPERIALHAAGNVALSNALALFMVVVIIGSLGAACSGLPSLNPASLFCGVAFGGTCAWMLSARLSYLPQIHGGPRGLDLQWVWGKPRHLEWQEVLEIQVDRMSSPQAKRFRVYLADEALEFNARADFAQLIAPWCEAARQDSAT
jgi:hypothetical protein